MNDEGTKLGATVLNKPSIYQGLCGSLQLDIAKTRQLLGWTGTLALDVALKALGIGPGDEVLVTPRTFIASVSCVANAGATPVFADVDADSGNLTAQTIAAVLTPRTKAVVCVHLAGWPCDMDPIMALSEQHGLKVIEDCAQAHGARYKGRSVGSIGHVGAWSFCQDKIMSTGGEGGMVTTQDETRDRINEAISAQGVPCYQGSCSEVHLERAFDGTPWRPPEPLPVARVLGETSLMFLLHPTLTPAEIDKTAAAAASVLREAAGA